MREVRCPSEQRIEFAFRAAARVILERLATGEHEHDKKCGHVFADEHRRNDRGDREDVESPVPTEDVAHHADRLPGCDREGIDAEHPLHRRTGACGGKDDPEHADHDRQRDHSVSASEPCDAGHTSSSLSSSAPG